LLQNGIFKKARCNFTEDENKDFRLKPKKGLLVPSCFKKLCKYKENLKKGHCFVRKNEIKIWKKSFYFMIFVLV
jgi:hypothetical protein